MRFTGRIGRRTLGPGTYSLTAHPAGRAQRTRRVVVIIGTGARQELDCSKSTEFTFLGTASFFDTAQGPAAAPTPTKNTPSTKKKEGSRGVLPAIAKKIREIPAAVPRPPLPGDAGSPPTILALLALALLALSGIAILAYVLRFLRGPHTKSA